MTYAVFKDMVCSYSNRLAALFATVGAVDVVLIAMNDARRDAQRRYTFNMTRRQAFVNLSMLPQSLLTDLRATPATGGTLVVTKRINGIYEYGAQAVGASTAYYPTREVDLRRMAQIGFSLPMRERTTTSTASAIREDFAYVLGNSVYHSNLTTQTWFLADVNEWLPDLTAAATTDIFLDYHTDWLKFATIANLNVWLKDAERFNIDATLMTTLWNSVTQFDAQQAEMGGISLD